MTDETINMRAQAVEELAREMVPAPEDALGDVGPMARLYYSQQIVYETVKLWLALLSGATGEGVDDDPKLTEALLALTLAAGNLDAACIAVGILDEAARSPEL